MRDSLDMDHGLCAERECQHRTDYRADSNDVSPGTNICSYLFVSDGSQKLAHKASAMMGIGSMDEVW